MLQCVRVCHTTQSQCVTQWCSDCHTMLQWLHSVSHNGVVTVVSHSVSNNVAVTVCHTMLQWLWHHVAVTLKRLWRAVCHTMLQWLWSAWRSWTICSVLQCVAACWWVLQRVAACCSVLQCVAVTLESIALMIHLRPAPHLAHPLCIYCHWSFSCALREGLLLSCLVWAPIFWQIYCTPQRRAFVPLSIHTSIHISIHTSIHTSIHNIVKILKCKWRWLDQCKLVSMYSMSLSSFIICCQLFG